MKTIYVSKPVSLPCPSFNWLWLSIAFVLRQFTTYANDRDIRELMDELTPDEARAEILSDWENAERNRLAGEFWSSG